MIQIKPELLYVRDPATNAFAPLLAIKGDKGDTGSIGNIGDYMTSETGDSEALAMTQKGATDIKEELDGRITDILNGKAKGVQTLIVENYNELMAACTYNRTCGIRFNYGTNLNSDPVFHIPQYSQGVLASNGAEAILTVITTDGVVLSAYFKSSDGIWVGRTSRHADTADLSAKFSYKLISSLDELTTLASGGMCYGIIMSAAITIDSLIFPKNSRGLLVSNGTAAFTAVGPDGVIYTAFYDNSAKTWHGARKSSHADTTTCISELVEWPDAATTVTDGDKYPPTANAVQARLSNIYFNFVDIKGAIQTLQNLYTSLDDRVLTLEVKASNA